MRAGPLLYEHHQLYAPSNRSPPAQVSQMPLDRGCTEVQPLRDFLVAAVMNGEATEQGEGIFFGAKATRLGARQGEI
jgi:hypothetical protein